MKKKSKFNDAFVILCSSVYHHFSVVTSKVV